LKTEGLHPADRGFQTEVSRFELYSLVQIHRRPSANGFDCPAIVNRNPAGIADLPVDPGVVFGVLVLAGQGLGDPGQNDAHPAACGTRAGPDLRLAEIPRRLTGRLWLFGDLAAAGCLEYTHREPGSHTRAPRLEHVVVWG